MYQLRNQPANELELKSCLFHLWAILRAHGERTENEGRQFAELRGVMEYIDREYAAHLTLADLAAVAHMSESHFCRTFSAVTTRRRFPICSKCAFKKAANI